MQERAEGTITQPMGFRCGGCLELFPSRLAREAHFHSPVVGAHGIPPDELAVAAGAFIIQYHGGRAQATAGALCSLMQNHSPPSSTDPEMSAYLRALETCQTDLVDGATLPREGWGTVISSDSLATITASRRGGTGRGQGSGKVTRFD